MSFVGSKAPTFVERSSNLWAVGGVCFVFIRSPGCLQRPLGVTSQAGTLVLPDLEDRLPFDDRALGILT